MKKKSVKKSPAKKASIKKAPAKKSQVKKDPIIRKEMKEGEQVEVEVTKEDIEFLQKADVSYEKAKMFMHCKTCIKDHQEGVFGGEQSPKDALSYAMGSVPLESPEGKVFNVVVVYCKRCEKPIWDSKHLTHLY